MAAKRSSLTNHRSGTPRLKPLAAALRALLFGSAALGFAEHPAWALPTPAEVIPDILPRGGVVTSGDAAIDDNGRAMTIRQQSPRAVLDWQSFNIGRKNSVEFKQPSSTAIALNNIRQADPSRIDGRLTANGQVYLINQNGFVFGSGSRVNVNSLVASTLKISDKNFQTGITKVFNDSTDTAALPALETDLTGRSRLYRTAEDGSEARREIRIEPGAQIKSAEGGRILVAAPWIDNQGTLETPNGQTILAAAQDKVYLQEAIPDVVNPDATEARNYVRGLLVEVGTGGKVANGAPGRIEAKRGNVTLAGFAVNQEGLVSATTAVSLNGSIRLIAREKQSPGVRRIGSNLVLEADSTRRSADNGDGLGTSARVVLGTGSLTQARPEAESRETALDAQSQVRGMIELMGKQIEMLESSTVSAPSGTILARATTAPATPADSAQSGEGTSIRVNVGARLDVAGLKNVPVPVTKNIVEVEPRSFELRDAPLQKDGPLFGKKVYVDIRNGTPRILDISGSTARIERTVAERSVSGGSIALSSPGEIEIQPEANLDISGGSIRYQSGYVRTTWLGSEGKYYEISKADPNRRYDSVLGEVSRTDRRWNVTRTWKIPGPVNSGRYEPGYLEGADGGTLDLKANRIRLDGQLSGHTLDGLHQRESGRRAAGSRLTVDLAFSENSVQSVALLGAARDLLTQLRPFLPAGDPLLGEPQGDFRERFLAITDRLLNRSGVRDTTIVSNEGIHLAEAADIDLPGEGSLTLRAGNIDVAGQLSAPSGAVHLSTERRDVGPSERASGAIHLARTARLDVSGRWTNDLPAARGRRTATGAVLTEGGTVTATAAGHLNLDAGAEIAADGGAWLKSNGTLVEGVGGRIALEAGPGLQGRLGSNLRLEGQLHAYGLNQGGSLELTSNRVLVGDVFASYEPSADGLEPLILSPDFLGSGGFQHYTLASNLHGLTVGEDAEIVLQADNRVLNDDYRDKPTGAALAGFGSIRRRSEVLRQPTHLTLVTEAPTNEGLFDLDRGIELQTGARILGDPGAHIELQSGKRILLAGTIGAPAGTIEATVATGTEIGFQRSQGIFLDSTARLLAPGAVKATLGGAPGLRDDEVLAGGEISLNARRGYLLLTSGSVLDVSGTSATVDEARPNPNGAGVRIVPAVHAAPAGSIALEAAEGMVLDGDLIGRSLRGQGARGGSLSMTLDKLFRDAGDKAGTYPAGPRLIEITQQRQPGMLDGWAFGTEIRDTPGGADLETRLNGRAFISARQIEAGGLDAVALKVRDDLADTYPNLPEQDQPAIRFLGDVDLSTGSRLVLDTPTLGLEPTPESPAPRVRLDTPFLSLGSSTVRGFPARTDRLPMATDGTGRLTARASNIELVGGMRLTGVGDTLLYSAGDIRLRGIMGNQSLDQPPRDLTGIFAAAGDLMLEARQIYPSTLSRYTLTLDGAIGNTLELRGGDGPASPPLSAGGQVVLSAPNIRHSGVLRAPLGDVTFNAAENLTVEAGGQVSVSAKGLTIPFGKTQGGLDWLYPLGSGINLVLGLANNEVVPPSGSVHINGKAIDLRSGSTIDLSGGGDLHAYELVPGRGGSVDPLDPADPNLGPGKSGLSYQEKYAVLPWLKDGWAPYDPYSTPKSGLQAGDAVYLADAAAGLPAGTYTLLPANYALLPGAYVVTPTQATNPQPGTIGSAVDGTPVVAGRRVEAGTRFGDFRWQAYTVETGRDFRRRTEYAESTANRFFPDRAERLDTSVPALPRDAASLAVEAGSRLDLGGAVLGKAAAGGRGGQLDISGDALRVVRQAGGESAGSNEILLLSDQLGNLNVESLLLGGIRKDDGEERRITVKSDTVAIDEGVELKGPEIVLAARDAIDVKSGASLRGEGNAKSETSVLAIADNGSGTDAALLRVAAGPQVEVVRETPAPGIRGTLNVASGAVLGAAGSATLDATAGARFAGTLDMPVGASLSLGARQINLGAVPEGTPGFSLTADSLQGFAGDELILRSGSVLGLYGDLAFRAGENLVIHAPGLAGFNVSGTARLEANRITLANPGGAAANPAGEGAAGTLHLKADQVLAFGEGNFSVGGFGSANLEAGARMRAGGSGGLHIAADATFITPLLAADNGATVTLDAAGHALRLASPNPDAGTGEGTGLGARISLVAASIGLDSRIGLPSGILEATAEQGIGIGPNARIDLSGITETYLDKDVHTAGGSLALASRAADISLAEGAAIDVSGEQRGGSVSLSAPRGTLQLKGSIQGGGQGSFRFEAGRLGEADASAILGYVESAGTAQRFDLRLHDGNLAIPADRTLKASEFNLSADRGDLAVAGTLDASGAKGGSIRLAAGDQVRLASTSRLSAGTDTANAEGGRIFIEAMDRDGDGNSGLVLESGATLEVRGGLLDNPAAPVGVDYVRAVVDGPTVPGADGKDHLAGEIQFRGLRNSLDLAALQAQVQAANIDGTQNGQLAVESVDVHENVATIDTPRIADWQKATEAYMNGLAPEAHPGLKVMPGLEIRHSGDITLKDDWDFAARTPDDPALWLWRYRPAAGAPGYSGTPGFLTIRAEGQLNLDANLSDAVAREELIYSEGSAIFNALLQPGESWSYRLVSGADAVSASSAETVRHETGGDIRIAPGRMAQDENTGLPKAETRLVRTGTGDIELHAGGSVKLGNEYSAIYTVGQVVDPDDPRRFGSFGKDSAPFDFYAEYPTRGGDIEITAGHDITGFEIAPASPALISDWLVRTGNWNPQSANVTEHIPVAWGIALGQNADLSPGQGFYIPPELQGFKQSVGALAGGDIRIAAGGNIEDLSVLIPTVGQSVGERVQNTLGRLDTVYNQVEVHGGGDMNIAAGGDIKGGMFYVEKGIGHLQAGGAVAGGKQYTAGPQWVLGDAVLNVDSRTDLAAGGLFNAFMLGERDTFGDSSVVTGESNFFNTYSDSSGARLRTLAGDIAFRNDPAGIAGSRDTAGLGFYPGTLSAHAYSGSIRLDGNIILAPVPTGNLEWFAEDSISGNGTINMSDTDPARLPAAVRPDTGLGNFNLGTDVFGTPQIIHKAVPVHAGDSQPALVATHRGDIVRDGPRFDWYLPKPLRMEAGRDIRDVNLVIQNLRDSDISEVTAGRDLVYVTSRNANGNLDNIGNTTRFRIAGPGQLVVRAGRNIDLGSSDGILSIANNQNPALSRTGASLTVLAGLAASFAGDSAALFDYLAGLGEGDAVTANTRLEELEREAPDFADRLVRQGWLVRGTDGRLSTPDRRLTGRAFKKDFDRLPEADRQALLDGLQSLSDGEAPRPAWAAFLSSFPYTVREEGGRLRVVEDARRSHMLRYLDSLNDAALEKLDRESPDWVARAVRYGWLARNETGTLQKQPVTEDAIKSTLETLSEAEQVALAVPVFFDSLRRAGVAAAKNPDQTEYYEPGFKAIDTLFPVKDGYAYQGDVSLFFSRLSTQFGGNIDLLVPGGLVNAGLTNAGDSLGTKKPGDLGIVVQAAGGINAFSRDDFIVNESRVVTLGGGDITLWSSDADIDAGKGAKSAISAPPPIVRPDENGNITVVFPAVLEGSGIRTASSLGPEFAGNVYLFAPRGIVDAGEAGIGGNNVVIAATAVVGASNIQVAGTSIGVPAAAPPVVVPGAASNAASSAAQQATQQVAENTGNKDEQAAKAQQAAQAALGGIIQVELLGFGSCSLGDIRGGQSGCGG